MLNVQFIEGNAVKAYTFDEAYEAFGREQTQAYFRDGTLRNRNDWTTYETVIALADALNAAAKARGESKVYVGIDDGPNVSPRYDVIEAPAMDAPVSYAFNGDYYPCGKVTKISDSLKRIEATDEAGAVKVFYRRKLSGCWKMAGGTWSLVAGHRSEMNPSF